MDRSTQPRVPDRRLLLKEARALVDLATLPLGFLRTPNTDKPAGATIVLPGFGAGERTMRPLERYRREGGVAWLVDRMIERVRRRADERGAPVALVGWSLGGTIAREVARDVPEAVQQVITLGSPVIGGPKYTAAARGLARRGLDIDWIEAQARLREARPVRVPITAVVSPSDAIVDFRAARDHHSENVEHIELDVAHLGMGINRKVWRVVLKRLQDR